MSSDLLPALQNFPATFPIEGAVRIELAEGIPIFRASSSVQERIETLLEPEFGLSRKEKIVIDRNRRFLRLVAIGN